MVGVDVSPERDDLNTLIPLLERMEKGIVQRYENLIADAGHENEENYEYLKANGQVSYIKPQIYEKSKTRRWQTNGYLIRTCRMTPKQIPIPARRPYHASCWTPAFKQQDGLRQRDHRI